MMLEVVLLTPVIVALLCLGAGLGRIAYGQQRLDAAAAAAARAASLTLAPPQAQQQAHQAAADTLQDSGISCRGLQVRTDTSAFAPGGQIIVTLTCTAALDDLAIAGLPGHHTLTATARTPLEANRVYQGGAS